MGSSHSAPRRSQERRRTSRQHSESSFYSTSTPNQAVRPRGNQRTGFDQENSNSAAIEEEVPPPLLEESDIDMIEEVNGRFPQNISPQSSRNHERQRGLAVIASGQRLRLEDMDPEVSNTESFTNNSDASVEETYSSSLPSNVSRTERDVVREANDVESTSHHDVEDFSQSGREENAETQEDTMGTYRPQFQPPIASLESPLVEPSDSEGRRQQSRRATVVSPTMESNSVDHSDNPGGPNIVILTSGSGNMQQWIVQDGMMDKDGHGSVAPPAPDFFPQGSRNNEWMGRSLETLILGYASVAHILCLPEDEEEWGDNFYFRGETRRRSTCSTLGSEFGRRSSLGSITGNRRGSLVSGGGMHGGTLANYYSGRRRGTNDSGGQRGTNDSGNSRPGSNSRTSGQRINRRGSTSHGPTYRRRMSMSRTTSEELKDDAMLSSSKGGPNVALSMLARECTGRRPFRNIHPATQQLRAVGGHALFGAVDRPAGGMCSEVSFLSEVIDSGDWAETQTVISRISPRLIGDPSTGMNGHRAPAANDPNLPPTASKFYAGGGRLGLERDAFVLAGGVEVLIRVFREPTFVGAEMARTYDARDLSEELVANRLALCWNETLACLRELAYAMPSLIVNGNIFDDGDFVPFLFTLLSHDSCFDAAAALLEEILSLQSHSPPQPQPDRDVSPEGCAVPQPTVRVSPPTTFFLGNVPDLYKLWAGFNCRQLAHFCRILALLVFEPEDRQLLESPAVLKSIELLQLRRNRAARAGRDSTVDMNQAILLGDEDLTRRLLKLLRVMNFAPSLRRSSSYHIMAHFPFIADTLVMLGLNEIENWDEIDRMDELSRRLLHEDNSRQVSELGSVSDMLEGLADSLMGNQGEFSTNQVGHIINVISAAQRAGVFIGRSRQSHAPRHGQGDNNGRGATSGSSSGYSDDFWGDQVFVRRVDSASVPGLNESDNPNAQVQVIGIGLEGGRDFRNSFTGYSSAGRRHVLPSSPEDAANSLQFNALLLGPYQVEVLFVLCTLLGGRRKIDAQEMLNELGAIPTLDDMFQRLPWDSLSQTRQIISQGGTESDRRNHTQQVSGIHGPGCECTPESALCVQYLRLLHNFCDRDCDNYVGRRLLLSREERNFVFNTSTASLNYDISALRPGLLSKIIAAFVGESDESPYRFWLASCVESYLRGSSPAEQIFVAQTGLLKHLINDITSQRLHCAGSLQTSFDLLGELCKGNAEVLHLLVSDLDEESFRKLMSVAAANLVDSNVFIRSLLLSLERISNASEFVPIHLDTELFGGRPGAWLSNTGTFSRSYLSHSWWDSCLVNLDVESEHDTEVDEAAKDDAIDVNRPTDWFPAISAVNNYGMLPPDQDGIPHAGLHDGVGHFGWVFTPVGESLSNEVHAPNTIERLSWFLAANQTRLLRDLLGVVDLRNINHENICCLNTAVVLAIFAHRRNQLHTLLKDLRMMSNEENETKRRAINAVQNDNVIDQAFVNAIKYLDIDRESPPAAYARRASLTRRGSTATGGQEIGDRNDILRNFRKVLWFWVEYYTHRGRDRLSLEFSSHLRFQEWIEVVALLGADNGTPTSLVRSPVRLPRSPYQRAARVVDEFHRGG